MQALTTAQPDVSAARPSVAPLVGSCSVVAAALLVAGFPVSAALIAAGGPAAAAARVDRAIQRLPNRLVALTAMPPVVVVAFAWFVGWNQLDDVSAVAVAVGALLAGAPLFLLHLAGPASMGFGDVKFAAALGANLGMLDPRLCVVALCAASFIGVIQGTLQNRRTVAFGPSLFAGAALAVLVTPLLERVV